MIKHMLAVVLLGLGIIACNSNTENTAAATAQTEEHDHDHDGHDHDHDHDHGDATAQQGDGKHFGETVEAAGAISYQELLTKMEKVDSLSSKVLATVNTVCQVKGCWMDIAGTSENSNSMRVRFKDYGFFVPKDISGRKVVMEGYAYREVTSVDELRHYAEDEGLSKEEIAKITEPQEELKFLASGVLLLD